ncbi:ABC transporter permease [Sphingobacterium sp. SYP-B4668]|uniref:ABC transporter permease n=1 Tax=Sphingobacterium sp. SYP-B4668 TaxID=2996035 RepID=UPI0022DDF13A|nr:ABC transporter permease [Sphingobacterium sp. SYP-B4668]
MLYKLGQSIVKEYLLLKRDFGGLVILFVMPLVLVITVTLIQQDSFDAISERKIPVLLVDEDQDTVAKTIQLQLEQSNALQIVTTLDGRKLTEQAAREAVNSGAFQLAIILPKYLTRDLNIKVSQNVESILGEYSLTEVDSTLLKTKVSGKEIKLFFDPATQMAFKNEVKNGIDKLISGIETKQIYRAFQDQLGDGNTQKTIQPQNFITFKEASPKIGKQEVIPNAVQHNVPAWSLFAIFFVIVPLSINIVKEKSQGTFIRLITNPIPYWMLIAGKTVTYLVICLVQFYLMLLMGVFVFPYFGLPALDISGRLMLMTVVTIFAGLAAIGLGLLLGTIAKTQEQSAPFGATLVVILAAVGGIWVPVFAMPHIMQYVAKISPMNWALQGFYDIILRHSGLLEVIPEIILLFLFFVLMVAVAVGYDKKKRFV